jgi:hypothetical protein
MGACQETGIAEFVQVLADRLGRDVKAGCQILNLYASQFSGENEDVTLSCTCDLHGRVRREGETF